MTLLDAVRNITAEHWKAGDSPLLFEPLDEDTAFVNLCCRTTSRDLPGERTDGPDIYSVLLAAHLRTCPLGYSSTLWDVRNPAVPCPGSQPKRHPPRFIPERPRHEYIGVVQAFRTNAS